MLKRLLSTALVFLFIAGAAFAQTGTLTGTVTDAESGEPMPGANVVIPELDRGTATDANGEYEITGIETGTYEVQASFIGYNQTTKTVEITTGETEANFSLSAGVNLNEVVVTALGQEASEASISFASQEVSAEDLTIAQSTNIKNSIAGKISGVQLVGQAGSKLGSFGNIRIRGAISLTDDLSEPLYVVDGVPVSNPNMVDMDNVESLNVLKGPNATALYGQRGENGVILISTQGGDRAGLSVELTNSFTVEQVSYLPNYQNQYGQGYSGQGEWGVFDYNASTMVPYFEPLDGVNYLQTTYADESWGPRFDGRQYAPWYSWFPDSPYYGETVAWEAQPNNIKEFFDRGYTNKGGFAINSAGDGYSARISYSNLTTNGLIPESSLNKHFMSGKFSYDVTDKLNVRANIKYTIQEVNGDVRNDDYSNQTTGTFNQWFGRQVNVNRLRQLSDLKTPEGIQTNWNWWGPGGNFPYSGVGPGNALLNRALKAPTFWFNPYTWVENFTNRYNRNNLLLNLNASYQFNQQLELSASSNITQEDYRRRYEVPYTFEFSSDQSGSLYNHWVNSFGQYQDVMKEQNHSIQLTYTDSYGDYSIDGLVGGNLRAENWEEFFANMSMSNYQSGGLLIPDVYQYSNSREQVIPVESDWNKRVYSLYAKGTIGYQDFLYLDGTYRQDWSSALPSDNNGYGYPSVGVSFVFSELVDIPYMSYGKIRGGWAQVGDDVEAEDILTSYTLDSDPYTNPATGARMPLLYTDPALVADNIKPALNTSYEAGFDVRFFNDRVGLEATYYNETRKDEIIGITLSTANGVTEYLTNAGSSQRQGVELSLDGVPYQGENFRWDVTANWATNETIITSLPRDLKAFEVPETSSAFGFVNITHRLNEEWGQLRGAAIARNENGQPIINPSTGLYEVEQNQYFGSVLPDWTGGLINSFTYKNVSLTAAIDFQKGGQFFTLTEQWGENSGLLAETVGLNDRGTPKRDPVSEGGGVHVTGVDAQGNPVDTYVSAYEYYHQWSDNYIADPFIHPRDYIKLRSLNLSYRLPQSWVGNYVNSATIGFVANNLWMIAVHPENEHGFDPSELAQTWGENGQLPGTRSYGVNVKVTF